MWPRLGALFAILLTTAPVVRAEPATHWAYQPVIRPTLPVVRNAAWPRNPIDCFILARLEAAGLTPSAVAPAHRLLRRVAFDLTGLPPSPAEVERFTSDLGPDAYDRAIDRCIHSPRYGERMATHWLDLARYADTHGYYVDSHRDMWRYRDEVIDAFNRHQPFDQFTIEQLAGDLLPNATLQQKIASGFNRNHMINFEPGAIPEEYHNEYVVNRVVTTATVWLGQTMQCAQCHDHKYDPFTQRDFYALAAFFDNVPEEGLDGRRGNAVPIIAAPTRNQQASLAQLQHKQQAVAQLLAQRAADSVAAQSEWEQNLRTGKQKLPGPPSGATVYLPLDEDEGDVCKNVALAASDSRYLSKITGSPVWTTGKFGNGLLFDGETSLNAGDVGAFGTTDRMSLALWVFPTTDDKMTLLARATSDDNHRGYELTLNEGRLTFLLCHKQPDERLLVSTKQPMRLSRWHHIAVTNDGSGRGEGIEVYINGQPQATEVVDNRLAGGSITADAPLLIGGTGERAFRGMLDEIRVYDRRLSPGEVELLAGSHPVMQVLAVPPSERSQLQIQQLRAFFLEHYDAVYRKILKEQAAIEESQRQLLAASPTTMVMAARKEPRATFVLERGDYREPGERVTAATPSIFPPLPKQEPADRLALARWLVNGQHPLTARVAVNHLWQLHFGTGLVRTPEDFGTRGEAPTHPELLDWLAAELVESGWNLQHIQQLIMTSATYRQDSATSAEQVRHDPDNRLLGRFPRRRLPAEMLRDQVLAASGLLCGDLYGPGVYPYQPAGLWEELGLAGGEFSAQAYSQSHDVSLYRRSIYTFWKRTSPAPDMTIFDAPDRQVCTVSRTATNTPLQALVLWNNTLYVEAARHMAANALATRTSDEETMNSLFKSVLSRRPTATEMRIVERMLVRQRDVYGKNRAAAERLLSVGESPLNTNLPATELAAWTCVAQALLTLDESLTCN